MKPGVWPASFSRSIDRLHRLAAGVDLEDLHAALAVGAVDGDLAVEAARAQQRRVEHVGTVGGRDQDDVVLGLEAVHLDEQLVERLLALVVTAAHAGAAVAADGVDLVHEDDAGAVLLGLLEEVADAAGADADEHLDEVGTGDREERHAGLAGDRAGEQRLAGARRAEAAERPWGYARPAPGSGAGLRRNSLTS